MQDACIFVREQEVRGGATNDTAENAEEVTFSNNRTDFLGYLDSPTDVDNFFFVGEAGVEMILVCKARRTGSGLEGATFTLSDATGTELQTETETDDEDVMWYDDYGSMDSIVFPTTGAYYLEVSATGQSATVISDFDYCMLINP